MQIVTRASTIAQGDASHFLYAPWADTLSPGNVDLLALLPIIGVNDAIETDLSEQDTGEPAVMQNAVACMMTADPFIHVPHVARRLRSRGIGAVANFPTVQLMDGETGRALDAGRCGSEREFEFLGEMAKSGFSITAFVSSLNALRRATELQCSRIVVHPGLPMKDWRLRAAAALQAGEIIKAAGSMAPAVDLLVYKPHGFGHELDATIAKADDSLVWLQS